ncbi:MAG: hypothetical protein LBF28_03105 [Rickettsiales bacterium]|jgi:hypothetical protein|nr:hypothetical protein [Rickettsiales bacterium]
MKTIMKIFSMAVTFAVMFMYKKDVGAGTAAGCSAAGYTTNYSYECSKGQYYANSCINCPGNGTTATKNKYRTSVIKCQPCNARGIATGQCDYLGQTNTFGLDLWMIATYNNYIIPITKCFMPRGAVYSDATGVGVYDSDCYYTTGTTSS